MMMGPLNRVLFQPRRNLAPRAISGTGAGGTRKRQFHDQRAQQGTGTTAVALNGSGSASPWHVTSLRTVGRRCRSSKVMTNTWTRPVFRGARAGGGGEHQASSGNKHQYPFYRPAAFIRNRFSTANTNAAQTRPARRARASTMSSDFSLTAGRVRSARKKGTSFIGSNRDLGAKSVQFLG